MLIIVMLIWMISGIVACNYLLYEAERGLTLNMFLIRSFIGMLTGFSIVIVVLITEYGKNTQHIYVIKPKDIK